MDGNKVIKTFFTKDLMLASSPATTLLTVKGAIGGSRFGSENFVFYSISQTANLLKALNAEDQTFTFSSSSTVEDIRMLPKDIEVKPDPYAPLPPAMSCSVIWNSNHRRDDDNQPPPAGGQGPPAGSSTQGNVYQASSLSSPQQRRCYLSAGPTRVR